MNRNLLIRLASLFVALTASAVTTAASDDKSQLMIGDSNWYNNNTQIQRQSMQLANKLKQQINDKHHQPLKPSLHSDAPKYRCEVDINSCVPLLIQQNVDGSNFFNRSWKEFKYGFNGSNGNYWIGNELLHQLTRDDIYKLRFDLQSRTTGLWYWAEYSTFVVLSERVKYKALTDGYTGNANHDAFRYVNGMMFTTHDSDNDASGGNCAKYNVGGFWYRVCAYCSMNAVYRQNDGFRWFSLPGSSHGGELKTSRMWLLCR